MSNRDRLVRLLAAGELRSGEFLAEALSVSRSAVWKQVCQLRELGLDIRAIGGRGYRLERSLELLDEAKIRSGLGADAEAACESLIVAPIVVSTSDELRSQQAPCAGNWRALLAEYQSGGRGRRGRRWLSPFGSGLCLSFSWCFESAPRDLPALSLAVGLAVRRVLAAAGATGLMLKWPNDIVLQGAKLGGILVDLDGDSRGPLRAIIGLGLNVSAPPSLVKDVMAEHGRPPAGFENAVEGVQVARNRLAALVIDALYAGVREFATCGFAGMVEEWRRYDCLSGRNVTVCEGAQQIAGIARGISPDGALLVERDGTVVLIMNGDVTLRPGVDIC